MEIAPLNLSFKIPSEGSFVTLAESNRQFLEMRDNKEDQVILRTKDLIFCFSGKKCPVVVPVVLLQDAMMRTHELCQTIQSMTVNDENQGLSVTTLAGVTEIRGADDTPGRALLRADSALVTAKDR